VTKRNHSRQAIRNDHEAALASGYSSPGRFIVPAPGAGETDPRFEPSVQDDRDLAWYFRWGPRPKYITRSKRRRWEAIDAALNGYGRGLCLYYTDPLRFGERWRVLNAALTEDEIDGASGGEALIYIRSTDTWAEHAEASGTNPFAVFQSLIASATERLVREYREYARRKRTRQRRTLTTELDRLGCEAAGIARLQERRTELFRGGRRREVVEIVQQPLGSAWWHQWGRMLTPIGTWGGCRVQPRTARYCLGGSAAGDSDARALERLQRSMREWGDWRREQRRERALWDREKREKVTRREIAAEQRAAREDIKAMYHAEPGPNVFDLAQCFGVKDQALMPGLWDPRHIEQKVGKATTTVSEIASKADLSTTFVRGMLIKRGCPGANVKRGRIPVEWFKTDQGRDFWDDAVPRERLALMKKKHNGRNG
jgi:hypothetical protein